VRGSAKAGKKRTGAGVVALLVVAVVWWIVQEWRARHPADGSLAPGRPEEFVRTPEQARAAAPEDVPTEGGYERYDGCRLIAHRNNDGDSFHVKLPDGREAEFRLYFVDTPESQRKSYGGGETNEVRIGHQARYFGISPDRSVELGAEAKKQVIEDAGRLAVHASSPVGSRSTGAGGSLPSCGWKTGPSCTSGWSARGLARIYTEGAAMPDGTSADDREKELKKLEAEAKRRGQPAAGGGRIRGASILLAAKSLRGRRAKCSRHELRCPVVAAACEIASRSRAADHWPGRWDRCPGNRS
jgi:hypothetical protein